MLEPCLDALKLRWFDAYHLQGSTDPRKWAFLYACFIFTIPLAAVHHDDGIASAERIPDLDLRRNNPLH